MLINGSGKIIQKRWVGKEIKMPVHRTKSGGYKYGKRGKTYYGKGAQKKAAKQGRAIKASQSKRKK